MIFFRVLYSTRKIIVCHWLQPRFSVHYIDFRFIDNYKFYMFTIKLKHYATKLKKKKYIFYYFRLVEVYHILPEWDLCSVNIESKFLFDEVL